MNHGITSHGGNREVKDTTLYFKKAWTYSRLFLFTSDPNGLRTADLSDLRNPRQLEPGPETFLENSKKSFLIL